MIDEPGFAGLIFSHLGKNSINIRAISQGSSEISISFIVDRKNELKDQRHRRRKSATSGEKENK